MPLFAALLTLLVLVAAYRFLISPLLSDRPRPDDPKTAAVEGGAEAFIAHLDDARKRIGLGHFRLALEKLQAAQGLCEQQPDACSPAQRRQLVQLTRQAELMVDRLAEPLEEVLRHAAGIQQTEWQADFRHRYRHKAVLFDVTIRPAGEDRYEVVYLLPVHEEWAHLEVNDLALLRRLQIQEPQRVLFGARLASISREPKRGWVVRLEADSGVLLTAAEVAIVCPYPPASPTEEEVRAVLQRQAEWAARE